MAGELGSGGVQHRARQQTPWLFGAVMIAIPVAFVGLMAIAPRLPKTVPGAPSPVFAVPFGNGTAKVIWRTPLNGGSAITGYRVTPYRGFFREPTRVVPAAATNTVFTGLRNGKPYRFEVTAVNDVGVGDVSRRSVPIVVGAPGQPARPAVTVGSSGTLAVVFTPPNTAGVPISTFSVTCASLNGGATRTASGLADPITVTAVTAGKSYTCTVRATNRLGTGPGSPPSNPVQTSR